MTTPRIGQLEQAMLSGEILKIRYNGGSQAGSIREIAPIKIKGDLLIARCIASNTTKSFRIDRIEIADSTAPVLYDGDYVREEPKDLVAALTNHITSLKDLGWDVEIEPKSCGLYRFFKNGKRRKTADIYVVYSNDSSTRPWYVRSEGSSQGRTFASLGGLVDFLMSEAKRFAPVLDSKRIG